MRVLQGRKKVTLEGNQRELKEEIKNRTSKYMVNTSGYILFK